MEEQEDKQEYFKTYYEKNKEVMGKQSKEWKIKNKEAWNSYQAAYKRKKYKEKKEQENRDKHIM
jgi:hypothetical protein